MAHDTHEGLLASLLDKVTSLEESNGRLAARVRTLEGCDSTKGRVDHDDEPVTRRGLLKKAGGVMAAGVAGAAVGSVLGATPAGAANGDPVILGAFNSASGAGTYIGNTNMEVGLASPGNGYAVWGDNGNVSGVGVYGSATGTGGKGVNGSGRGLNGIGVRGLTDGHNSQIGVRGETLNGNGEGIGVHGVTKNGYGVLAESTTLSGAGLVVRGRSFFDRSGKVAIAQGQASKQIYLAALQATSLVLATIQGNVAGTYVRGVQLDLVHGAFVIRLNKAAPVNLTVGWFVVN